MKSNLSKKISLLWRLQALLLKTGSFYPFSYCNIVIINFTCGKPVIVDICLIIKQSWNDIQPLEFFFQS